MTKKIICLYISLIICVLSFVGCEGLNKYYWDYECNWVCDTPQITIYKGAGGGEMTIDGVTYNFYTRRANNATYIYFYTIENNDFQNRIYLLKADTVFENDKLYLTITEDYISNYQGQTFVFEKKPI